MSAREVLDELHDRDYELTRRGVDELHDLNGRYMASKFFMVAGYTGAVIGAGTATHGELQAANLKTASQHNMEISQQLTPAIQQSETTAGLGLAGGGACLLLALAATFVHRANKKAIGEFEKRGVAHRNAKKGFTGSTFGGKRDAAFN